MKPYKGYSSNDALFHTFEGDLYRTRDNVIIRPGYAYQRNECNSAADVAACLRHGEHAWPGGYRIYFITTDGAALSFDAVRDNWYSVVYSMHHAIDDGWRVAGCACSAYTDEHPYCDHTNVLLD